MHLNLSAPAWRDRSGLPGQARDASSPKPRTLRFLSPMATRHRKGTDAATERGGRRSRVVARREEHGLDGSEGKWRVIDSALRSTPIEPILLRLHQHLPVDVSPQDAPCGAGYGFGFAEPFAESALHLSRPGGNLQAEQPPSRVGDASSPRVNGAIHGAYPPTGRGGSVFLRALVRGFPRPLTLVSGSGLCLGRGCESGVGYNVSRVWLILGIDR